MEFQLWEWSYFSGQMVKAMECRRQFILTGSSQTKNEGHNFLNVLDSSLLSTCFAFFHLTIPWEGITLSDTPVAEYIDHAGSAILFTV